MKKILTLLLLTCCFSVAAAENAKGIQWQPWSQDIFDQAKRENRLVLLDLEAIWCHWCHVMEEKTYSDPAVIALIQKKYIAVKVDQDSRPDLSNRYEDYGWPATVVFNAAGGEIIKRSGYIAPGQFASLLQAIIEDPTPGPSVNAEADLEPAASPFLSMALRDELRKSHLDSYDAKHGGWGEFHKFLEPNSVEYAMNKARGGDMQAEQMAKKTLARELHLVDPVWGGVYQYSVGGDWFEPHFEKIMATQTANLRIYALAYAQWHDPLYLGAARDIQRFLTTFLSSPDGAFYTSQDADVVEGQHSAAYFKLDDAARRKQGIPRVDKNIYARENGWAIDAFATLYAVTGEQIYLDQATRAARWIIAYRALPNGGFSHAAQDAAGPYLGDTLAMGNAFLNLYNVTGERDWLMRATAAASYIASNFGDATTLGYLTSKSATNSAYKPRPLRDENIALARFANLLFHYTADQKHQMVAQNAMRYLAIPQIANKLPSSGVLLADEELSADPIHVTVVGHKDDASAQALFSAAIGYSAAYKRTEWWDKREGNLPNPDVQYPELGMPAAFVCTARTFSSPIFTPQEVGTRLKPSGKAAPKGFGQTRMDTGIAAQ